MTMEKRNIIAVDRTPGLGKSAAADEEAELRSALDMFDNPLKLLSQDQGVAPEPVEDKDER